MPGQGRAEDIEELIKEIAVKNGIAVSRDDPIMILQTINSRLLEDGRKAQEKLLNHYKEEMEGAALRWGNEATGKAELIIKASLEASKNVMISIMQEEANKTIKAFRSEIDSSLANLTGNIGDARRISVFNVIAACITLCAAGIALWATLT